MTKPAICVGCGRKPQAYHRRRFCYDCKPGSKGRPLPCRRCGSPNDYYSEGLCVRCHLFAPQLPNSCRDCYAWGATRTLKWLCWACKEWRRSRSKYPVAIGRCIACRNERPVNHHGACRLCWGQAKRLRRPGEPLDIIAANRHGQQLMLADISSPKNGYRPRPRRARWRPANDAVEAPSEERGASKVHPEQLDLLVPDPLAEAARRYGADDPPSGLLAERLDGVIVDHADRYSWRQSRTWSTRVTMRVLLAMAKVTTLPIRTSDIARLRTIDLPTRSILAILTEADLLIDDRPSTVETWFDHHVADLPEPMASELRVWFDVLHRGSTTPPRSQPRAPTTIKTRLTWALPTLTDWAQAGHHSLREISRDQIIAVLPASGTPRVKLGSALRSIFSTLKARKIVFTNPTTRIRIGNFERRTPLPADTDRLGAALNAPDPATAALAALLIFHGLRPAELRDLKLTDIRDGRCHLPDRTVLLADPVKARLTAYLNYRHHRWPNSLNPHFFVHRLSASATGPVSRWWVNGRLGMPAGAVRQDRIVDEALATGGDLRRICDLFGVTIATAQHYTTVLTHPDLIDTSPAGSRATEDV